MSLLSTAPPPPQAPHKHSPSQQQLPHFGDLLLVDHLSHLHCLPVINIASFRPRLHPASKNLIFSQFKNPPVSLHCSAMKPQHSHEGMTHVPGHQPSTPFMHSNPKAPHPFTGLHPSAKNTLPTPTPAQLPVVLRISSGKLSSSVLPYRTHFCCCLLYMCL